LTPTETTSCALETSPENDAFLVCASISPPAFTLASPSLEAGRSEGEGGRGDPPVEPELSSNPIFPTTSSSESSFLVAAGGSARGIVRFRLGYRRRADWDDCVQEIQIRILIKLPHWTGRARFCHWVRVVASRAAIDWVRGLNKVQLTGVEATEVGLSGREPTISPEDIIKCVEEAAIRFPDRIRQVYEMRRDGLTNEEIARRLGVSIGLVYNRLRMMRDLLRHCLEP
jgi:RNA polymerase sigma factor (sigma-70 family)